MVFYFGFYFYFLFIHNFYLTKMNKTNNTNSTDVDHYLENVSDDARTSLQKLREQIKKLVPAAEECISYGMPAFRYYGMLVGYAAFPHHCGFYTMSPAVMESLREVLQSYDTSKGTIRFVPGKMLPVSLVKKIVKAPMIENEVRRKANKN
jgi:uncharacterized protein YdhG (YjbR/CyaY superfamily)